MEKVRSNLLTLYLDFIKTPEDIIIPADILKNPYLTGYMGAFVELFFQLNVYFKFSFHMISKKIRKFSRGKSGKYKVVYNYIPFFKRERYKAKQFYKNLKYMEGRNFKSRLRNLVNLYRYNFKKTTIYYERSKAMKFIFKKQYNSVLLQCK